MHAFNDHNGNGFWHPSKIAATHEPHNEPHEDLSPAAPRTPAQRKRAGRRAWLLLGVIGVGAVAAAAASSYPRLGVPQELAEVTHQLDNARRTVTVVSPTAAKSRPEIRLPGSTSALQETIVYARTNGYIAGFNADIGDHVKAGQLLATIASPEVDQQLLEARARLDESRANLALAETRLKRFKDMYKTSVATTQELDDAQAVYNSQLATLRVSEAVVKRLQTDQSYQKVVAPFNGIVTKRNVDMGSLITAGSGSNVTSLFELQQETTMRVFVDVPQSWAPSITPGTSATVELREFPNETFEAKVVRTSGALDPATRTLRTELHLPNSDGRLIPGMYAQVKLSPDSATQPLVVPASTLVIDSAGTRVVSVDDSNKVTHLPVKIGRDFGKEIEVIRGVTPTMRLVVSPREDLHDGEVVTIATAAKTTVASR